MFLDEEVPPVTNLSQAASPQTFVENRQRPQTSSSWATLYSVGDIFSKLPWNVVHQLPKGDERAEERRLRLEIDMGEDSKKPKNPHVHRYFLGRRAGDDLGVVLGRYGEVCLYHRRCWRAQTIELSHGASNDDDPSRHIGTTAY